MGDIKESLDKVSSEKAELQVVLENKEKEIINLQESSEAKLIIKEHEEKIASLEVELDVMKNFVSQKDIEFKKIEIDIKKSLENVKQEKAELQFVLENREKEITHLQIEKENLQQVAEEKAELQVVLEDKNKEIIHLQESSEAKLIIKENEEKIATLEVELNEMKNFVSQKEIEFQKIEFD